MADQQPADQQTVDQRDAAEVAGAPGAGRGGDIIVTARKRQESILKVPVVVTAVSGARLDNVQANTITDLPKLVPGLVLGGNLLSVGPQVTIRGVGTSSYDPGVDQSVSLNIDGMSLGQGLAFGSAMFDIGQVEVLKGPQALFYGKASPGGVISLRTADPTDRTEVILRAGYDFEARDKRGEAIISGPLTETLGARIAALYSDGDGFFRNRAVPILSTGAAAPYRRETQPRNFVVRGTLLWKPDSAFSARLKVNHAYDRNINAEAGQLASCPDGPGKAFGFGSGLPGSPIPAAPNFLTPVDPVPFIGGDDCKLDRNINNVYMNPDFFPGIPNNGVPFLRNKQDFGTLELNYDLAPEVTLTSNTAYYDLRSVSLVNTTHTTAAAPILAVSNQFERRQFTQELRLNSDFSGPINFSAGAFYEDGRIYDRVTYYRNTAYGFTSPAIVGGDFFNVDAATTVDIRTYSLFGQLRYKLTEQLELSGGVRWTDEARTQRVVDFVRNVDITSTLPRPRVAFTNFSPEATINYTPTDDLTVFASYKQGFKSGSFKIAVPAGPGENNAFNEETVKGYEVGVKSRLFDRTVLANVAFYDYYYDGLQVGGIEQVQSGVPTIRTVNAGAARTYGVDFDASWYPRAIEGLSFTGSVSWNNGRYTRLDNLPCYTGQTIAQGCTQQPSAFTGLFTAQDLSGSQLIRSPRWSANLGADYEVPLGSDMRLLFSTNNQYSSRYVTFPAIGRPNEDNFQGKFIKVDASMTLKGPQNRWEMALVGKNITKQITASNCSATNYAGGTALGGQVTGGPNRSPTGISEVGCNTDAGRSVWVRLTWRPFS